MQSSANTLTSSTSFPTCFTAAEVELSAASLSSGDAFLLKPSDPAAPVLLWRGSGSTAVEEEVAARVGAVLGPELSTVQVRRG